jgi:hypothetical protein
VSTIYEPTTKSSSNIGFPVFSPGQLLQHDDLSALAGYTQQLTRLLFRSLFGCGVVCGLCVRTRIKCDKLTVEVEPGVALDCEGDPIHVPKTAELVFEKEPDKCTNDLWVILRGTRKHCAPRPSECSSDEDEVRTGWTREQYWYEIQVRKDLPKCVCGCVKFPEPGASGKPEPQLLKECYAKHGSGECECECSCTHCDCQWILLAKLERVKDLEWAPLHEYRRFIRPALAQDTYCSKPKPPEETAEEPAKETPREKTKEPPKAKTPAPK